MKLRNARLFSKGFKVYNVIHLKIEHNQFKVINYTEKENLQNFYEALENDP